MIQALDIGAQILILLLLPPLLIGVINKVKAAFAGRVGPRLLQPYYDLVKLARKASVTSRTTTWVFLAGPAVTLVAVACAGLLLPLGAGPAAVAFTGDFVLFVYLFALARFFTAAAALDTGSPFEGMGAARDVSYAALAEVALAFGLLTLAALSHGTSLSHMLGGLSADMRSAATGALVLVAAGFAIVLLAENARIPVDDPNTHLELTMIHEVMILDHSGPALGVIHYAAALKLFILSALLARVVLPPIAAPALALGASVLVILAVAVAIGVVESLMARLRLTRVPALLVAACLLTGFGFLLAVK